MSGPWAPRTLLRASSPCVPGPVGARAVRAGFGSIHTIPNAVDWFLFSIEKTSSRNHRSCAQCGELTFVQVRGLSTGDSHVGNRGTNPGLRPQSSSELRLSTVVHRLSTGYPPGLSPALWTTLGRYRLVVPRTFNRKSTPVHRMCVLSSPSVSVHIDFPRSCPHLCRLTDKGCPPLGIKGCGLLWISVDNVGTTRLRSDVDIPAHAWMGPLERFRGASSRGRTVIHRLWEKVWKTPKRATFG
jgi:hypothetical protein